MYCKKCGSFQPDGTQYCSNCGAEQDSFLESRANPRRSVNFGEAIQLFFTRYFDFHGRSRRSEYWYIVLFNFIVSAVIGMILPDLAGIYSLIILIPSLALCVRRLHDIGKSGWWYLLFCIPLVGGIILLVFFCQDSQGNNKWGRSPKY